MRQFIDVTGKTEDEAIQNALRQLGLDRDDVSVEILERAKSGFLGLGSCPAKVRVSYGPEEEEEVLAPAPAPKEKPQEERPKPPKAEKPPRQERKPAEAPAPAPEEKTRQSAPVQTLGEEVMTRRPRPSVSSSPACWSRWRVLRRSTSICWRRAATR